MDKSSLPPLPAGGCYSHKWRIIAGAAASAHTVECLVCKLQWPAPVDGAGCPVGTLYTIRALCHIDSMHPKESE